MSSGNFFLYKNMIDIQNNYCPNKFEKLLSATKYSQKGGNSSTSIPTFQLTSPLMLCSQQYLFGWSRTDYGDSQLATLIPSKFYLQARPYKLKLYLRSPNFPFHNILI